MTSCYFPRETTAWLSLPIGAFVKNELEKGRRLTSAPVLHYYLVEARAVRRAACAEGFRSFCFFRSSSGLGLNPCNGSVGDVIWLCYKISDPTFWKSPIRSDLIFRKSPIRRLGNLRTRSFGSLRSDPIFSEISDLRNLRSSHFVLDDLLVPVTIVVRRKESPPPQTILLGPS